MINESTASFEEMVERGEQILLTFSYDAMMRIESFPSPH